MTGWKCPNCEQTQVCSFYEYSKIYNYRHGFKRASGKIISQLFNHGVERLSADERGEYGGEKETDYDIFKRWLKQEKPEKKDSDNSISDCVGPEYICANCLDIWTVQDVP